MARYTCTKMKKILTNTELGNKTRLSGLCLSLGDTCNPMELFPLEAAFRSCETQPLVETAP
ncbi:hypothetical protein SK128_020823 [Halocaridina rubra]|uniref:Uncharacterized protein n=1 Tax=Halocaridina rubra TaxID=373956 RepID=A0AAN8WI26_HALRR